MTLFLHVHGTDACVDSPDFDFRRFVERNYSPFLGTKSSPVVRTYFSREWGDYARSSGQSLPRYGDGLFASRDALYWENAFGFKSLIQISDDTVNVFAYHSGLDQEFGLEPRLRNFQRSMRWAVHFPVFALQRWEHNRHLTHAAAVANSDGAWVFAGLNGVGKSTLAARLLNRNGWRHVSDNFLLGDETVLYPFPETLRLSDDSLRATRGADLALPETSVYGKHHVRAVQVAQPVTPHVGFLVTNTSHLTLDPLETKQALRILRSLHDWLKEFPEYGYFAALPILDRFANGPDARVPSCLGEARWYRLGLPLDWSLDSAVDRILACA